MRRKEIKIIKDQLAEIRGSPSLDTKYVAFDGEISAKCLRQVVKISFGAEALPAGQRDKVPLFVHDRPWFADKLCGLPCMSPIFNQFPDRFMTFSRHLHGKTVGFLNCEGDRTLVLLLCLDSKAILSLQGIELSASRIFQTL